jgi:uncharacterized protein (DUF1800 family)
MPRWNDIALLLAKTPSEAVDILLETTSNPTPPTNANNVTESLDGLNLALQEQTKAVWRQDCEALRVWWTDLMVGSGVSIAEKLTAFWSGHFTSEFETEDEFVQAPLLYRQNKLLRDNGLGNLRQLTKAITLDGGMLVYLGGNDNNAGAPNENYGRELLELFTTGIGQYTEGDVKNAARILTGWHVARYSDKPFPNGLFETYFTASTHDVNGKEFMTVSFPARDTTTNTEFIVRRDEIYRLIDVIFEQRPRAIAEHISRKLYRFFVYSNPSDSDEAVIAGMADIMVANDFNIKPVISALLKSAHFFDNLNIGAQIKTPLEFEVGLARQLGLGGRLSDGTRTLGQTIFDPPNVSGWTGYHDWITTTSYPIRSDIAQSAVASATEALLLGLISGIPNSDTLDTFIDRLAAVLLPRPLSPERKTALKTKLTAGAPDYEWSQIVGGSPSTAARNLRDMLTTLVALPDFQLC